MKDRSDCTNQHHTTVHVYLYLYLHLYVQGKKGKRTLKGFFLLRMSNKGEQSQRCSPTKRNKIKSGCLTPTFSAAQKRAEVCAGGGRGMVNSFSQSQITSQYKKILSNFSSPIHIQSAYTFPTITPTLRDAGGFCAALSLTLFPGCLY